jgi:hypothetical protein
MIRAPGALPDHVLIALPDHVLIALPDHVPVHHP